MIFSKKSQKFLSFIFPWFVVILAWVNGKRLTLSYSYFLFVVIFVGGAALLYLVLRERKGAFLPAGRSWPLALAVFVYLLARFITMDNLYAGIPRFLYLMTLGLFFLIAWDAFDKYVDRNTVLYGLLGVSSVIQLMSLSEVYQKYLDWWTAFGFGKPAPYAYRVVSPLNSSNPLMGMMNMLLPIAVVLFFQEKAFLKRIFLLFWGLFYVAIFLFSSSRGGYVGAAVAAFSLLALTFLRLDLWGKFRALEKKRQTLVLVGLILVLVVGAVVGYQFVLKTSAHPSHGGSTGEISFNRTGIWQGYLNIWKQNPWWGSGPGLYALTYLEANQTTPPRFWPTYSHSFPIGILAEFGTVGALLIFGMLVAAALSILKRYWALEKGAQLLASGVLAGVISLVAHSVFDDFLYWQTVFFTCLVLIVWLFTAGHAANRSRVRYFWLAPVIVSLMVLGWWNLRPYQVMDQARKAFQNGTISQTAFAEGLSQAVELAPGSHFYQTEAGLYWYNAWLETGTPNALEKANDYLATSLELEPFVSIMWVNKALVSWQLGETGQTVEELERAIALAPDEPVYHLNLGHYLEALGQTEAATEQYRRTLDLSKSLEWYTHPYWQQTDLRQQVLTKWMAENELANEGELLLDDFWQALAQPGATPSALEIYKTLDWQSDINRLPERLMMRAVLEDQPEQKAELLARSYQYAYRPARLLPLGWWEKVYYLTGWNQPFLPGVLQLSQNFGNLDGDVFDRLVQELEEDLPDAEIQLLYQEYQRAILGGE